MTDFTAEAPVRANKAPPKGRRVPCTAASPSPTAIQKVTVVDQAAAQAVGMASVLMTQIVGLDDLSYIGPASDLFRQADSFITMLAYGDKDDQPVSVGSHEVRRASAMLEVAIETAEAASGMAPRGTLLVVVTLALQALDVLSRISQALELSAITLDYLRALDTYDGVRPYHDRSQPPSQQAPQRSGRTATANADIAFERNMPGRVVFADRAELERFVAKSAASISCLNVVLQAAVTLESTSKDWLAGDFLPDFAAFVSDQVYEHQEAVGALLKAGGAA